ncbi:hypothetical protein ACC841_36265, partial [Rhizobium ruizarguesonis]
LKYFVTLVPKGGKAAIHCIADHDVREARDPNFSHSLLQRRNTCLWGLEPAVTVNPKCRQEFPV